VGYWSTIGVIVWGFAVSVGVIYFAAVYGFLGMFVWIALNVSISYWLNRARGHSRAEAFDDRLTDERMREAQEELIKKWKKRQG
jgi:hypothetical protein